MLTMTAVAPPQPRYKSFDLSATPPPVSGDQIIQLRRSDALTLKGQPQDARRLLRRTASMDLTGDVARLARRHTEQPRRESAQATTHNSNAARSQSPKPGGGGGGDGDPAATRASFARSRADSIDIKRTDNDLHSLHARPRSSSVSAAMAAAVAAATSNGSGSTASSTGLSPATVGGGGLGALNSGGSVSSMFNALAQQSFGSGGGGGGGGGGGASSYTPSRSWFNRRPSISESRNGSDA